MDYSISVDHLSRQEVLNQLQLEKSPYDTEKLKKILMTRLKKCHPIWSSLKKLEANELRRFAILVNINTQHKNDMKVRIELANYFFVTNPSRPLTAFEQIAFQSYPDLNKTNTYSEEDTHTNKDTNIDSETLKDIYTNTYSEKDNHTNKNTNTNSDALKDTYSNTYTEKDTNTNPDALKDTYTNTHTDKDTNTNPDALKDTYTNTPMNKKNTTTNTYDTNTSIDLNSNKDSFFYDDKNFDNNTNIDNDTNTNNFDEIYSYDDTDTNIDTNTNIDDKTNPDTNMNNKSRSQPDNMTTQNQQPHSTNQSHFAGLKLRNPPGQNLCFVNTILNLLSSSVYYRESLENTPCNCNLCKFMKIAVKYPSRPYSTNDLRAWIINTNRPHFSEKVVANVFKQQDAHEFLTALTELCENLNRLTSFTKKTSRICTICFETSDLVRSLCTQYPKVIIILKASIR